MHVYLKNNVSRLHIVASNSCVIIIIIIIIIIITIIITIIRFINFIIIFLVIIYMQDIYKFMHKTNHISTVHSFAAVLYLQIVLHVLLCRT